MHRECGNWPSNRSFGLVGLDWRRLMTTELLNTESAAGFLDVKPATLISWRHRRIGPPFLRLGRLIRYRPVDLIAWLDTRISCPAA
jgi:hypothetical protein